MMLGITAAFAEPIIYPTKGQSAEQLEKDKLECYTWAKNETGFDPMSSSDTATAQAQTKSGGAAKGALVGGATGAIFGNKSKHTRNAAITGAVIGGGAQASSNKKSQQQAQQVNNNTAARQSEYDRAHSACLEGRGYTVK
jgi:uncharacterized membrane protein YebE (DUF533 family)